MKFVLIPLLLALLFFKGSHAWCFLFWCQDDPVEEPIDVEGKSKELKNSSTLLQNTIITAVSKLNNSLHENVINNEIRLLILKDKVKYYAKKPSALIEPTKSCIEFVSFRINSLQPIAVSACDPDLESLKNQVYAYGNNITLELNNFSNLCKAVLSEKELSQCQKTELKKIEDNLNETRSTWDRNSKHISEGIEKCFAKKEEEYKDDEQDLENCFELE